MWNYPQVNAKMVKTKKSKYEAHFDFLRKGYHVEKTHKITINFFFPFLSLIAKNCLKFFVFREKSKCEKNATHTQYIRNIMNHGQVLLLKRFLLSI